MVIIGADQYLSNSAFYKHRYLGNIKKYKSAGKFDDQQKYKANIEATTVSTSEVFTYNSPI